MAGGRPFLDTQQRAVLRSRFAVRTAVLRSRTAPYIGLGVTSMNPRTSSRSWSRWLPAFAAIWLVLVALLAIQAWPDLPRTTGQWLLFVALGPPLYVLGEAFFAWLFSPTRGHSISPKQFSVARIAIALPVVLALFALSWWLSSLLG